MRPDYLAVACDDTRSEIERMEAYRCFEAEAWYRCHIQRGLPFDAIPFEFTDRVRALIVERDSIRNIIDYKHNRR